MPSPPATYPVVVLDMATLVFRRDTTTQLLGVATTTGEVLAVVDCSAQDDLRAVTWASLDAALLTGAVLRTGPSGESQRCRIALYNPFTAEVALAGAEHPLGCRAPLELTTTGSCGVFDTATGELQVGELTLAAQPTTLLLVSQRVAAHAA